MVTAREFGDFHWQVRLPPVILKEIKYIQKRLKDFDQEWKSVRDSADSRQRPKIQDVVRARNHVDYELKQLMGMILKGGSNTDFRKMDLGEMERSNVFARYKAKQKHLDEDLQKQADELHKRIENLHNAWRKYARSDVTKDMLHHADRLKFHKAAKDLKINIVKYVKKRRQIEDLTRISKKIVQGYKFRLKIMAKRHEILKSINYKYENISRTTRGKKVEPKFARESDQDKNTIRWKLHEELEYLLRQEQRLLGTLGSDLDQAKVTLKNGVFMFKQFEKDLVNVWLPTIASIPIQKTGKEKFGLLMSSFEKGVKVRIAPLRAFLKRMQKFMDLLHRDIDHISKRIEAETRYITSRKKTAFTSFVKSWRQETKANDQLVRHLYKTLRKDRGAVGGIIAHSGTGWTYARAGRNAFILGGALALCTYIGIPAAAFQSIATIIGTTPAGAAMFYEMAMLATVLEGTTDMLRGLLSFVDPREYDSLMANVRDDQKRLKELQRQLPHRWWNRIW